MSYAFVDIEELKSKGISLSTVSSAKSYKKLKNSNEREYLIKTWNLIF